MYLSPEEIETEMVDSCHLIRDITQGKRVPFAFPFHGRGVKGSLLADICSRNPVIGSVFDTQGIKKHNRLVFDRIWADVPGRETGTSNLPDLLHLAGQDMILDWPRKLKRETLMDAC